MLRNTLFALLLVASVITFIPVPQASANETGNTQLLGAWKLTHRPVNAAKEPCSYLPESLEVFSHQTLIMSNFPNMPMSFKTELTDAETQAMVARSASFKGKSLLLVKPNPMMDWLSTPMVYVYSVTKEGLSLTVEGWEPATFKRVQ